MAAQLSVCPSYESDDWLLTSDFPLRIAFGCQFEVFLSSKVRATLTGANPHDGSPRAGSSTKVARSLSQQIPWARMPGRNRGGATQRFRRIIAPGSSLQQALTYRHASAVSSHRLPPTAVRHCAKPHTAHVHVRQPCGATTAKSLHSRSRSKA
jgi:hypothetical protein